MANKKVYTTPDLVDTAMDAYNSIDEQAILDRYNQATAAQYAAQQNQNMIAENNFYNQMYNTQKTAMDTIRQSNAAAVSTGASRGMQAANELSALLGLQQESIASATELANARRQTAQEETAAMLQNIVQASKDAADQRTQALQSAIQAKSLQATEDRLTADIIKEGGDVAEYFNPNSVTNTRTNMLNAGLLGEQGSYTTTYNPDAETYASFVLNDDNSTTDTYKQLIQDLGITDVDIQKAMKAQPGLTLVLGMLPSTTTVANLLYAGKKTGLDVSNIFNTIYRTKFNVNS